MDERETDESEELEPQGVGQDKAIGRRAFIGLLVAGLAALFLGRPLLAPLLGRISSATGDQGFRINSVAATPPFDEATWEVKFDGLFRKPSTLTFSELTDLPQVTRTRDFYCVEGWGVKNVAWKGVATSEIMRQFDIDPSATHLVFYSGDAAGYSDSMTIAEASRDDTMLAYQMNGEPLPPDMGRPLRTVFPGDFGYKYVKWVVRVEAAYLPNSGYSGYWERRGYPQDATIR